MCQITHMGRRIKPGYIHPFIFMTGFIAAYSARSSMFDVGVAFVFGIIGYLMRRSGLSVAAFNTAFVLAKGAEESYRQSMLMSDSGNLIFLQRPIALAFIAIAALVIGLRAFRRLKTGVSSPPA